MKKESPVYLVLIALIIFSIYFVSAQNFMANNPNQNTISKTAQSGNFYNYTKQVSPTVSPTDSHLAKSSMRALSSDINTITILWPVSGYYYITDALQLKITTANPSSCTYTFNGETKNMIDNETDHSYSIYRLTDNMASDEPYTIDFSCNDGSQTTSASTYFKINTSELDKYFIRSNLGNWNYNNSERSGYINKDGFIEFYRAYYDKISDKNIIRNEVVFLIYDSKSSLEAGVKKNFLDYYNSSISVQSIGDKNFYVISDSDSKFIAWSSENYFVTNWVYAYQNTTPVDLQISNEILNPYLSKYPNDLRYGVCGDGKVNVLNLNGTKEDCDKNSQMISCGSNIGECKIGKKTRKCKSDCTWDNWGICNATAPKTETCDSKDNNCDGKTDESFPLLNQTCYAGVGACKQEGKYICSFSGSNVTCNAIAKTSQKENCNDGIDNDCDGKIDFNDTNDCTLLKINSLINGFNYSNKNILFDIYSDFNPNDITYSYMNNHGKTIIVKLCSKCNSYNKTKSFNDGFYNLTIMISNKSQIFSKKQISFLVDSTPPKIFETLPKKGFTNGNFNIEFKEDNPKILILNYDKQKKSLNMSKECILEKGIRSCSIYVNLSIFNGKEMQYYFNLTDITGKNVVSRPINLTVDTTLPKVKINWTIEQGKVNFIFNVTEVNFDKINYIDSSALKPKEMALCSRLKNGICEVSRRFNIGTHNLTIFTSDKSGNTLISKINFNF